MKKINLNTRNGNSFHMNAVKLKSKLTYITRFLFFTFLLIAWNESVEGKEPSSTAISEEAKEGSSTAIAEFSYDCEPCVASDEIHFLNESENAEAYLWQFGDGNTSDEKNPVHVYENTGTFVITLKSKDEAGNYAQTSKKIEIGERDVSCKDFAPRKCPDKTECLDCLHSQCCDIIIECLKDEKCKQCFESGNYVPCAGHEISEELTICSATNCRACNTCY